MMKPFTAETPHKGRMLWIVLLSTIALAWTTPIPLIEDSEELDEPCFDPCYCEVKESLFHIHCDNKGFINISQITQSWSRPFKLYLQRNSMRKLYTNSFLHLNNAVSINLGNNALQDIQTGAFNGLRVLKRLYLHENKLDIFRNDTFLGLESLEYLQADYNVIKRIESGAFRNLSKLRVLILNDNLIPMLPTNLFKSVSLTHLDLRGNRLKVLSYRGMLDHIGRSLMEIQLEENPWNCTCEIVQLKSWLERIPYTALVGDITCETPFHFHGKDLYFEYNLIREIQPAAFSLMPNLKLLFLNDNLLRTLPTDAFAGTSLARLNLRNNHFLALPVAGVLEHLHAIVQIDLKLNPWDCTCELVPLKQWLEALSSVSVVGEVLCASPEALARRDLRSLELAALCPAALRPAVASLPAAPPPPAATGAAAYELPPAAAAVPLSVLILSLLVLFFSAVLVAAGLFAFVLRRRRRKLPFRGPRGEATDLGGVPLRCPRLFEEGGGGGGGGGGGSSGGRECSPEKAPPAGHVYDYIPHPVTQMCNNPIYKPREEEEVAGGGGGEAAELLRGGGERFTAAAQDPGTNYRTLLEKEQEWSLAVSSSQLNTIVAVHPQHPAGGGLAAGSGGLGAAAGGGAPRDRDRPPPLTVGFVDCLYGTVPKLKELHVHPPGMQYPDLQQDARLKETLLFAAGKGFPDHQTPTSEYLELRAKLQTKPDYLEVLEKTTYRF